MFQLCITLFITAGIIIGGADFLLGGKAGLGKHLKEGLDMFGTLSMYMVGIICFEPIILGYCKDFIIKAAALINIDPSIAFAFLSVDMGGYILSAKLAVNPLVGQWYGIIITSIFGATLTFTLPIGIAVLEKKNHQTYLQGMIIGMITSPVSYIVGGLYIGLSVSDMLKNGWPVFLLLLIISLGYLFFPKIIFRFFSIFSNLLVKLTSLGLILIMISEALGQQLIKGTNSFQTAVASVASVCVTLSGCLVSFQILKRIIEKPLVKIGKRLGLNGDSIFGIIICFVSCIPVYTLYNGMNKNGQILCSSILVSGTGILGSLLAFVIVNNNAMVVPFILSKAVGIISAITGCFAFFALNRHLHPPHN